MKNKNGVLSLHVKLFERMALKLLHLLLVAGAYSLAVIYVLFRMLQIFPGKSRWGKAACWLSGAMSLFFIFVLFLRLFDLRSWYLPFQTVAYLWMTFVFYVFIFCLLFTLFRVITTWIPPLRRWLAPRMLTIQRGYALFTFVFVCGLLVYGMYHFTKPKVVELTLEVDKPVPDWKIVAVGDLHLGTMSADLLNHHVDTINAMKPDVVLLLGDQFVINWRDVTPMGYAAALRRLRAPKGVYAIHGNHEEYHKISHNNDPRVEQLFKYMKIKLLDDTALVVGDSLVLAGRADTSRLYTRKPLGELVDDVPNSLPIVLLDHRPDNMGQAHNYGIDVQLSGHTHDGQLFPMNLWHTCKSFFNGKLYHGYRNMEGTHCYVTAGLGGSGAPIRIGTTGEIVVISLKQK
jgi:hypothetical protein